MAKVKLQKDQDFVEIRITSFLLLNIPSNKTLDKYVHAELTHSIQLCEYCSQIMFPGKIFFSCCDSYPHF